MTLCSNSVRYKAAMFVFIAFIVLLCSAESMAQDDQVNPFKFRFSTVDSLIPGDTVTINLLKSAGSEEIRGFDFLIAYEADNITLLDIIPGSIYNIPGVYEWEYIDSPPGPYSNCGSGCPTGLVQILSLADITNGVHHPLNDPQTGRIKIIPDGTVLFSLQFEVSASVSTTLERIPIYFFWNHCSATGIAFTYRTESTLNVLQGNSDRVFDYNGSYYVDISDPVSTLPAASGSPDECLPICGDVNSDQTVNILDILFFIEYKFVEGPEPNSFVASDVNGDGTLDILDIIYFIDFKYQGGPALSCAVTNVRFVDFYNGGLFKPQR